LRLADRSAPTKGSSPEGTGYDIYDLFDLGEFDQKGNKATKWGSKEDLLSAIKVAADKGIITYIDAVLNHK
jgi:alpha-amylase